MAARQGITAQITQSADDARRSLLNTAPPSLLNHRWFSNMNTTCTIKSAPPRTPEVMTLLSTRAGWLVKRNEQGVWQRRYCCVVPHTFLYYFDAEPISGGGSVPPSPAASGHGGGGGGGVGGLGVGGTHAGYVYGGAPTHPGGEDSDSGERPPPPPPNEFGDYTTASLSAGPVGIIDLECYSQINRLKMDESNTIHGSNEEVTMELTGDAITNPDLRSFFFRGNNPADCESWTTALLSDRHQALRDEREAYRQVCESFPIQLQELGRMVDEAEGKASEKELESYQVRSSAEEGRKHIIELVRECIETLASPGGSCGLAGSSKDAVVAPGTPLRRRMGSSGNLAGGNIPGTPTHGRRGSGSDLSGASASSAANHNHNHNHIPSGGGSRTLTGEINTGFQKKLRGHQQSFLSRLDNIMSQNHHRIMGGAPESVSLLVNLLETLVADYHESYQRLHRAEQELQKKSFVPRSEMAEMEDKLRRQSQTHEKREERSKARIAELERSCNALQKDKTDLEQMLHTTRMENSIHAKNTKSKLKELVEHRRILKKEVIDLRGHVENTKSEMDVVKHQKDVLSQKYADEKRRRSALSENYKLLREQLSVQERVWGMMQSSLHSVAAGGSVAPILHGPGDGSVAPPPFPSTSGMVSLPPENIVMGGGDLGVGRSSGGVGHRGNSGEQRDTVRAGGNVAESSTMLYGNRTSFHPRDVVVKKRMADGGGGGNSDGGGGGPQEEENSRKSHQSGASSYDQSSRRSGMSLADSVSTGEGEDSVTASTSNTNNKTGGGGDGPDGEGGSTREGASDDGDRMIVRDASRLLDTAGVDLDNDGMDKVDVHDDDDEELHDGAASGVMRMRAAPPLHPNNRPAAYHSKNKSLGEVSFDMSEITTDVHLMMGTMARHDALGDCVSELGGVEEVAERRTDGHNNGTQGPPTQFMATSGISADDDGKINRADHGGHNGGSPGGDTSGSLDADEPIVVEDDMGEMRNSVKVQESRRANKGSTNRGLASPSRADNDENEEETGIEQLLSSPNSALSPERGRVSQEIQALRGLRKVSGSKATTPIRGTDLSDEARNRGMTFMNNPSLRTIPSEGGTSYATEDRVEHDDERDHPPKTVSTEGMCSIRSSGEDNGARKSGGGTLGMDEVVDTACEARGGSQQPNGDVPNTIQSERDEKDSLPFTRDDASNEGAESKRDGEEVKLCGNDTPTTVTTAETGTSASGVSAGVSTPTEEVASPSKRTKSQRKSRNHRDKSSSKSSRSEKSPRSSRSTKTRSGGGSSISRRSRDHDASDRDAPPPPPPLTSYSTPVSGRTPDAMRPPHPSSTNSTFMANYQNFMDSSASVISTRSAKSTMSSGMNRAGDVASVSAASNAEKLSVAERARLQANSPDQSQVVKVANASPNARATTPSTPLRKQPNNAKQPVHGRSPSTDSRGGWLGALGNRLNEAIDNSVLGVKVGGEDGRTPGRRPANKPPEPSPVPPPVPQDKKAEAAGRSFSTGRGSFASTAAAEEPSAPSYATPSRRQVGDRKWGGKSETQGEQDDGNKTPLHIRQQMQKEKQLAFLRERGLLK